MGNVCFTPLEGGELVRIAVPNPPGSSDWIYTVPAGYEMTPLAITWQISTSALAGNRYVGYRFLGPAADPVQFRMLTIFTTVIIAGQARGMVLHLESSRTNQAIVDFYHDALPQVRYPAGYRWGSASYALLVGYQFFNIYQTVVRWRV